MVEPRKSQAEHARLFMEETQQRIKKSQGERLIAAKAVLEKKQAQKGRGKASEKSAYVRAYLACSDCVAFIPKEELTTEICVGAVTTSPTAISFIPEKFRTEALSYAALEACMAVYKTEGYSDQVDRIIEVLQGCVQTEELCLKAISQASHAHANKFSICGLLGVIHDQTEAICEKAVMELPYEVIFIRPENMKEEYADIPLGNTAGRAIEYLDLTEDRCLKAVGQGGHNLKFMLDIFYDKSLEVDADKICVTALRKTGLSLLEIPKEFLTKDLCSIAVQQHIGALRFVPDEFITKELFDEIVAVGAQNKQVLINGKYKSAGDVFFRDYWSRMSEKAICAFLQVTKHGLSYIPKQEITKRECQKALRCSSTSITDIPDQFLTVDICTEFLKKYAKEPHRSIGIAPTRFRRAASVALKDDGTLLALCPEAVLTEGFIKTALKQNVYAYRSVPESFQTEKIQMEAISAKPELLRDTVHPTANAIRCALNSEADYAAVEPYIQGLSGEEVFDILEEFGISLRN